MITAETILWSAANEVNEAANEAWLNGRIDVAEALKLEAIRLLQRIENGLPDTRQHHSGTEND